MKKSQIAAIVFTLTCSSGLRQAGAQFFPPFNAGQFVPQNIEGFTVAGMGFVSAKPNQLEIELEVSASSEMTADAIVKYRDARRRIREAFTALKLQNVALEERGVLVDQKGMMQNPYFFDGMPNQRSKTEMQLTRKLFVTGSEVRKLDEESVLQLVAKLLDVAQDAGARVVGQPGEFNPYIYYRWNQPGGPLVRFVLDDFDKLQEEAFEKAIADARSRAARLARLSGVELGPIVAIREISVPSDRSTTAADEPPRKRLETSKFQEIPVRVDLLVRFDVNSKTSANGRTQGR
jgi:uncharacterized protein YggE